MIPAERWLGYGIGYSLIVLWAFMQWHGKLPSVKSFQDITATVNSRGGNILWLGAFSIFFFCFSVWMFFWSLNRISEGKITTDNAVMMMALTWLTGGAFGSAFGAMLKTMTGESSSSRRSDYGNQSGDGTGTVTTSMTFSGHNINAV